MDAPRCSPSPAHRRCSRSPSSRCNSFADAELQMRRHGWPGWSWLRASRDHAARAFEIAVWHARLRSTRPAAVDIIGRNQQVIAGRAVLIAVALAGLFALAGRGFAQEFPTGPITFVVAFPPGGSTDVVMRAIAPKLQERLGKPAGLQQRSRAA